MKQILKNSFSNEEDKIILKGFRIVACPYCNSHFSYERKDVSYSIGEVMSEISMNISMPTIGVIPFVTCPVCNKPMRHDKTFEFKSANDHISETRLKRKLKEKYGSEM